MDHNIYFRVNHVPSIKGAGFLTLCILLHVTCVKTGGFHYSVQDFMSRFGIESLVSVMSGLSSLVLAAIMGKHYWLRNKLLKKEVREGKQEDHEEEQDNK